MTLRSIIRDNAMSNSLNSAILASLSPLVRIRLPKTRSLNELASSSYRLLTILPTHHQDRVVSMPDDRIGDASYKRSPNPSQTTAPHHQVGPYLLGQEDYLLVGPPRHQVRLRHGDPGLPHPRQLCLQQLFRLLVQRLLIARRQGIYLGSHVALLYSYPPLAQQLPHVGYVQLRAGPRRKVCCALGRQDPLLRAIRGQQYLGRKDYRLPAHH